LHLARAIGPKAAKAFHPITFVSEEIRNKKYHLSGQKKDSTTAKNKFAASY
jgi:hypothetical protein